MDGYAGFSNLVEARKDASIPLAFCWAHARRPFYEFHTSTKSPLAAEVLARIARLYEIDGDIRCQPPDLRKAVRQRRSRPLVEALHIWLKEHLPRIPGSDLAKAMRCALRHWDGLVLYLADGQLEMDANSLFDKSAAGTRHCCRGTGTRTARLYSCHRVVAANNCDAPMCGFNDSTARFLEARNPPNDTQ